MTDMLHHSLLHAKYLNSRDTVHSSIHLIFAEIVITNKLNSYDFGSSLLPTQERCGHSEQTWRMT